MIRFRKTKFKKVSVGDHVLRGHTVSTVVSIHKTTCIYSNRTVAKRIVLQCGDHDVVGHPNDLVLTERVRAAA